MADQKISQLTAATTPLAGTEVFPIVQSGATVKATIANVQAAPVSAGTANGVQYLNGSKVPTTGTGIVFDGNYFGVNQQTPTAPIHAKTRAVVGNPNAYFEDGSDGSGVFVSSVSGANARFIAGDSFYYSAGQWRSKNTTSTIVNLFNGSLEVFANTGLTANTNFTPTSRFSVPATGNAIVSTAGKGFQLPGGITWTSGSGSPEGAVTAPVGSLYSRSDGGAGTSLYVKESGSGSTGWVGK